MLKSSDCDEGTITIPITIHTTDIVRALQRTKANSPPSADNINGHADEYRPTQPSCHLVKFAVDIVLLSLLSRCIVNLLCNSSLKLNIREPKVNDPWFSGRDCCGVQTPSQHWGYPKEVPPKRGLTQETKLLFQG